jgi:hypothetical protein
MTGPNAMLGATCLGRPGSPEANPIALASTSRYVGIVSTKARKPPRSTRDWTAKEKVAVVHGDGSVARGRTWARSFAGRRAARAKAQGHDRGTAAPSIKPGLDGGVVRRSRRSRSASLSERLLREAKLDGHCDEPDLRRVAGPGARGRGALLGLVLGITCMRSPIFVTWYTHEHQYGRIRLVTPTRPHAGVDTELLTHRTEVIPSADRGEARSLEPIEIVRLIPATTATDSRK